MEKPSWQSTVVAVGFIGLVGLMFWKASDHDFANIWQGVGTVVGVITGAVPGYFFAKQANDRAEAAAKRSEAYALISPPPPDPGQGPLAEPRPPSIWFYLAVTVVAVASLALVAYLVTMATDHDFTVIWAGVGSLAGVLVSAVPSLLLASDANKRAATAKGDAANAAQRVPAQSAPQVVQLLQSLR